jgi:hypothetical protein
MRFFHLTKTEAINRAYPFFDLLFIPNPQNHFKPNLLVLSLEDHRGISRHSHTSPGLIEIGKCAGSTSAKLSHKAHGSLHVPGPYHCKRLKREFEAQQTLSSKRSNKPRHTKLICLPHSNLKGTRYSLREIELIAWNLRERRGV